MAMRGSIVDIVRRAFGLDGRRRRASRQASGNIPVAAPATAWDAAASAPPTFTMDDDKAAEPAEK